MAVRHYLIGTLAALLIASSVSSSATNENDGGMGIDAGNTISNALELASLANVSGTLSAVDDRDWFYQDHTPDITTPVCMDARLTSNYTTALRLSVVHGNAVLETVALQAGGVTGIAAPGFAGAFYELSGEATTIPPLRPYAITSTRVDLPTSLPLDNDGNAGVDASAANPLAMTTGCVLGATKTAQGDASDVYTFAGTAGNTVLVSLASHSSSANLVVAAPDGTALASFGAGTIQSILLEATGTYTMTASGTNNGLIPYAIGLCEPKCEPPQRPCEPMCIDLVRTT